MNIQTFCEKLPDATKDDIDFLEKTLIFNPKQRLSIDEAFSHKIFEQVELWSTFRILVVKRITCIIILYYI